MVLVEDELDVNRLRRTYAIRNRRQSVLEKVMSLIERGHEDDEAIVVPELNIMVTCPVDQHLKDTYRRLCDDLNLQYRDSFRTGCEKKFAYSLRRATRIEVVPSLWYGGISIDCFLPGIGGKFERLPDGRGIKMKGVAVEIDGPIHNAAPKGKKDEFKGEFLKSQAVGVYSVDNWDINHPTVVAMIRKIRFESRLDSRTRKHLWRRIYMETILHHADEWTLQHLFGFNFLEVECKLRELNV